MSKLSTEQIRMDIMRAMGWELRGPSAYCAPEQLEWVHSSGRRISSLPDPFTNAADCEALEIWALDHRICTLLTEVVRRDDSVRCDIWDKGSRRPVSCEVDHNGTAADMIRARREAVCRAIHSAVTREGDDA